MTWIEWTAKIRAAMPAARKYSVRVEEQNYSRVQPPRIKFNIWDDTLNTHFTASTPEAAFAAWHDAAFSADVDAVAAQVGELPETQEAK